MRAGQARDVAAMVDCYSEGFEYDDRRSWSGNPIGDLRWVAEQILAQYSRFECRTLAVRGKHLQLGWWRWSNDSGFETTHLVVNETGDDGRFIYEGRFDEDDFAGAYRELERRYYAGEGAAFAEPGGIATEAAIALARGDIEGAFNGFGIPDQHFENRSRSAFPDPDVSDLAVSFKTLAAMVATVRMWPAVTCWLSETCAVVRLEREAVGHDGDQYHWTWISVHEIRDGRFVSACLFDLDDEEAAFAYAEERVREAQRR